METTKMSLEQKLKAYCNINDITNIQVGIDYSHFLAQLPKNITVLQAWNTQDFLAIGIWKLIRENFADEDFFQIGDITSPIPIKQPRPFLQALFELENDIQSDTLYVIDEAAKIAFVHQQGDEVYEKLIKNIDHKKSKIYVM